VLVFLGSTPVGAPLLGLVAERFGARAPLIGGGVAALAVVLVVALVLARRRRAHRPLRASTR
jgi:high-affinity Fe2+/Pb2+ permease